MEEKRKITVQQGNTATELSLKAFEIHFEFLKTVGAVSLTLFGIIVGLGRIFPQLKTLPSEVTQCLLFCVQALYSLSLATLALGILGVYVCLYSFVLGRRNLADQYAGAISNRISGDSSHGNDIAVRTKDVSMFYTYAGRVGLISLMVSVICFAAYAIVTIWI
ncbi:MAG: hypothetical protein WCG93_13665 [Paludibacter sp.]